MKKALDPKTRRTASDPTGKEYGFDYRRAKSNRFAPEGDERWGLPWSSNQMLLRCSDLRNMRLRSAISAMR